MSHLKKKYGFALTGGWQPIETAPKDGTKIDILLNSKSRIPEVYWGIFDGYQASIRMWIVGQGNPILKKGEVYKITHWMPIPEAPEEKSNLNVLEVGK